jgi:ubiquinone biosynthesis protein UbiJ
LARLATLVQLVVRARYRRGDIKAWDAIGDVSAELGIPHSRASALYYGRADRYPQDIGEDEVAAVRRQATELLMREADELRRRANALEAEIEQIKRENTEAPAWLSGPASVSGGSL